jgi:predicted nucleic acid-binding protein
VSFFVDTGFIYALADEDDADHARVREVFEGLNPERLREQCLTTNHVVAETITLASSRGLGHGEAVRLGELLYAESLARIHWATPDEERDAFAYFKRHQDKRYSFVDCLSFVVMEKLQIREALAVDTHFTHRFVARPGPR